MGLVGQVTNDYTCLTGANNGEADTVLPTEFDHYAKFAADNKSPPFRL